MLGFTMGFVAFPVLHYYRWVTPIEEVIHQLHMYTVLHGNKWIVIVRMDVTGYIWIKRRYQRIHMDDI